MWETTELTGTTHVSEDPLVMVGQFIIFIVTVIYTTQTF